MKRPYKRALAAYGPVYGSGLRTVKQWVKTGVGNHDPCPLDRPEDMPAWWERNMRHAVPIKIWNAANGDPGPPTPWNPAPGPRPPAVAAANVTATVAPLAASVPVPAGDPQAGATDAADLLSFAAGEDLDEDLPMPEGKLGLEAEYDRIEILTARLGKVASQPGKTKPYLDALARMTMLHKKLREEKERTRELIPRDEAERIIHDFHGPLEREIRIMLDPVCAILQVPVVPEITRKWNSLVDQMCVKLQQYVFE